MQQDIKKLFSNAFFGPRRKSAIHHYFYFPYPIF